MKRFRTKWDHHLESLALRMDKCTTCSSVKGYINTHGLITKMKAFLSIRAPMLYSFISKCNNGQAPAIRIRGKEYTMTYQTRKLLVYSLASLPLMFNNRGFIKRYAFWSLLFCRETFNPRYYKFNHPSTKTNQSNNSASSSPSPEKNAKI